MSMASAQPEAAPTIREIIFQGTEDLPAAAHAQLAAIVQPLLGQRFDDGVPAVLREALLESGWFEEAHITVQPVDDGVILVVQLEPNVTVQSIGFTGNTALSDAELLAAIPVQLGQVFHVNLARESAALIQELYAERGYPLTAVTDITFTEARALSFNIQEVHVSEIRIEGLVQTRESVIRRVITIAPGDVFSEAALRDTLVSLQRLQIFDEIAIIPHVGDEPGTVILTITVSERRSGTLLVGGTYSEVGGFSGYANFGYLNLFGAAQRVNLLLQAGATDIYQLDYFNPLVFSNDLSLGASLFYRQAERQLVAGEQELSYLARRQGGVATAYWRRDPVTQLLTSVRVVNMRALPDHNPDVPAIILGETQVRSLTLGGIRDTRPNPSYPVSGSFLHASAESAGWFGGEDFFKLSGDGRYYWPLGGGEGGRLPRVLAARLLAGSSSGTPPFLDQFFLGGVETLRGYEADRFVGNNMLLMSMEFRLPFSESVQGAAFIDAGDAWGGPFAEALGDRKFSLHLGYGVGVRINTPLGLLRFDFAFNKEGGNQLHFGLGNAL